jgi:hypothetical protein
VVVTQWPLALELQRLLETLACLLEEAVVAQPRGVIGEPHGRPRMPAKARSESTNSPRVLVDRARARGRAKRGDGVIHVSLGQSREDPAAPVGIEALDDALSGLAELHYFGGLTHPEIAQALSPSTVDRDLRLARAWLRRELG